VASVLAEAPRTADPKVLLRSEAVDCRLTVSRKLKAEFSV
jgi:hypothetical protein